MQEEKEEAAVEVEDQDQAEGETVEVAVAVLRAATAAAAEDSAKDEVAAREATITAHHRPTQLPRTSMLLP